MYRALEMTVLLDVFETFFSFFLWLYQNMDIEICISGLSQHENMLAWKEFLLAGKVKVLSRTFFSLDFLKHFNT